MRFLSGCHFVAARDGFPGPRGSVNARCAHVDSPRALLATSLRDYANPPCRGSRCEDSAAFPVCHGLERNGLATRAVLTNVPSRAEVRVSSHPRSGPMRGSHGLPPSLLPTQAKRFRRQTVAHMPYHSQCCAKPAASSSVSVPLKICTSANWPWKLLAGIFSQLFHAPMRKPYRFSNRPRPRPYLPAGLPST